MKSENFEDDDEQSAATEEQKTQLPVKSAIDATKAAAIVATLLEKNTDIFNKSSPENSNWMAQDAIVIPHLAASAIQHENKHLMTYIMGENNQ
jgi:hypothetical protein